MIDYRALCVGWPVTCWVSLGDIAERVSSLLGVATFRPSPESFETGSFSHAYLPLRSSFACSPWRRTAISCRGFFPLRDISVRCPQFARLPNPALRSVRRLSQPLDGLLHLSALRTYFIPQPRPGFTTVQGFLPLRSRFGSSPSRAPLSLSAFRSPASRLPLPASSTSRL